jgi:hypothetical protein
MPKFLAAKLKKEYPGNDKAVYGTLNKVGAMNGSKETAKGAAMEEKHEADEKAAPKKKTPMTYRPGFGARRGQ